MTAPKISVITTTSNQSASIALCIESVIAQRYPNFEHIVVDCGSTDATLDVLKTYSHIIVIPDTFGGRSHGLNTAISKASGEIIACVDVNERLVEGAFVRATQGLEVKQFALGQNGTSIFYNALKYWSSSTIQSCPSIFFKKSFLGLVEYPNDGSFFDESLQYCSQLDLLLRMCEVCEPFIIDSGLLSYSSNSPSSNNAPTVVQERSRIFRRHERKAGQCESRFSFIVSMTNYSDKIERTLLSIEAQTFPDVEVVVVGVGNDERLNRKSLRAFEEGLQKTAVRYVNVDMQNSNLALSAGVFESRSPFVCLLREGDTVSEDFVLKVMNRFCHDSIGMVLLSADDSFSEISEVAWFQENKTAWPIAIRKIAVQDAGEFSCRDDNNQSARDLFLKLSSKEWRVFS